MGSQTEAAMPRQAHPVGGVFRVSSCPTMAGLSWVNSLPPFAQESGGLGQAGLG